MIIIIVPLVPGTEWQELLDALGIETDVLALDQPPVRMWQELLDALGIETSTRRNSRVASSPGGKSCSMLSESRRM